MTSFVTAGPLNVCALALCIAALGAAPSLALETGASDMLHDAGEDVDELPAIDGSEEAVYLDFNAPLERITAALLRTSSYKWSYKAFDALLKRHGRHKVRTAIAERLRAISDRALVQMHKGAAADRLSPLHDLRLPGDVWASK